MSCKWIFTDPESGKKIEFNSKEDLDIYVNKNKEEIIYDLNNKKFNDENLVLNQEAKGAYDTVNQIMYALTDPNVSTLVHELAHFWERYLTDGERKQILDWSKHNEWTRETSENFAKGFETYLSEGKTNNPELKSVFEKFAKWLVDIYTDIKKALGIELNDNMRGIYEKMLNSEFIPDNIKTKIEEIEKPIEIKNISIDINTSDQEVFTIDIKNNNENVGQIKANNDGTYLTINEANVSIPRKGIGIEAYRQLAKKAKELGLTLQSDSFKRLSPEATGLWEKLVAANEAIKGKNSYTYQIKEVPVFEVKKLSNKKVSDIFSDLHKENVDLLENLLLNWNNSELVIDGAFLKIKSYIGRDAQYSKGAEGGSKFGGKKEFINWIMSEEPFNSKKYTVDQEWIDSINKAREIITKTTDYNYQVKEQLPVDKIEKQTNLVLTYENNIDYKTGLDGENHITIIDNEGNMIQNPNNDLDGYTFETTEEAKAFIDEYNAINAKSDAKLATLEQQSKTEETIPNVEDKKADIEIGKVGNTEYELKSDGVYFKDKKLDNPENKTHRQLIEADIERRSQEAFEQITSPEDFEELGLKQNKDEPPYSTTLDVGDENLEETLFADSKEELIDKINAKYDAELKAVESLLSKEQTSTASDVDWSKDIESVDLGKVDWKNPTTEESIAGHESNIQNNVKKGQQSLLPAIRELAKKYNLTKEQYLNVLPSIRKVLSNKEPNINSIENIIAREGKNNPKSESLLSKEQTPTEDTEAKKAEVKRRRQEISSFFNKNDYTTEVTLENDEYTLKVYDKKSTFSNVPIFKFQGNIIDIDGKKYINVYEVSTKKEYQNKKIATNSYKYILENLPSGVKGLYSFSEMRKGVMVPNIYKTLSKDYTVTTDSKGNILVNYDAELKALQSTETITPNKSEIEVIDKYNKKQLNTEEPKKEVAKEEQKKVSKEKPIKDKFEKTDEDIDQTLLTTKNVNIEENEKLSRPKEDLKVFDIKYKGKVIDSIYENLEEPEKTSNNYTIVGDDINGYNILDNNRYIKTKSENKVSFIEDGVKEYGKITSEHERYYNITLDNGEKRQVKKTSVSFEENNLEFNTKEEAQSYIDKVNEENSKLVSTGWFNLNGDDLGVNTQEEAVKTVIDSYNDKNGLTKSKVKDTKDYIEFTVGKGTSKKTIIGQVTKIDTLGEKSRLYTFIDKDGNTFEKVVNNPKRLVTATKDEFNNQIGIEKPTAKWTGKVRLEDGTITTLIGYITRHIPNTTNFEVIYKTSTGKFIPEEAIAGKARNTEIENLEEINKKQTKRVVVLTNIAKQFSNLFGGDILYSIKDMNIYDKDGNFVAYPFEAPARFKNGVVEINTGYSDRKYTREEIDFHNENDPFDVPWLKRETVAHEFMHPFVLSLKMSNEVLYKNLIKELNENHKDIIDHVNKLVERGTYDEKLKSDEALTIYLGRELTKAFTKAGTLNKEYIKNRPLLDKFIDWLHDIIDYLTGKKKPKTLEQFVNDANINKALQKETVQNIMAEIPELKNIFTSKDNDLSKKIRTLLKNKEQVRETLKDSPEAFYQLYEVIDNYVNNKDVGLSRFVFEIRPTNEHYVEFDHTDTETVKVYIDPSISNEKTIASVLVNYGKMHQDIIFNKSLEKLGLDKTEYTKTELLNNEKVVKELDKEGYFLYDEYIKTVKNNFYQYGDRKKLERQIGVSDLNPLMKLNDLNNYILYQLNSDNPVKIKYNDNEFAAIDKLEAYMNLDSDKATKLRKNIITKLPLLKETGEIRLNSETLKLNYNIINKLNLDENDVDFVLKYTQQAQTSLAVARRQWFEMLDELRLKQGKVTKEELTRLNKELGVVRQLISFYDEFRQYSRFEDEFSDTDIIKFNKTLKGLDDIRSSMNDAAINLTVEWFTKYANEHNKYIKQEGYTNDEYLITPEKLRNFFKYGTGRDTNYITYWLGSNITNRDPINAMFANTLSDMLSFNNIEITYKTFDVNEAFNKFLKAKGLGNVSNKDQIKYYKENYLREAELLVNEYDEKTGEKSEKYIKKLALHQEFLFDKYNKDLNEIRKKYSNPRSGEEQDLFQDKIEEWQQSKNYGKSEEYRNPEYDKIKNDEYFKILEKHYNESNEKYGNNKLKYGIIPQKYDVNFLEKAQRFIDGVKSDEPTNEKLTKLKEDIKVGLAGIKKDNRNYNLDGSIYREISTDLTNLKKDENISLDLHSSIVDFIAESTNYATLKETQYQAETLSLLLTGNTKFDIKARTFAQEDFSRKLREPIQLQKAKEQLAELEKLKNNGEEYDEILYNTLKEKVEKGIQPYNLWDKILPILKPSKTNYNNEMLLQQINDVYFGESQEEMKIGNISANKLAHYLGLYTSINNMAGNVVAGISNINVGNLQLFIEAHGGQYFNKKELAKATSDYIANIPNFIKDLQSPIKSKDTQLSFLLDAIQGEVQDEFGTRITGNIAKKMFRVNSLFFLTSLGEHQIQITGMKAMLLGRKVKTKSGETISLYDAFIPDEAGRYSLRKDIDFTQADLSKFIRDLHGVNRALNGNYSELNKTMLARKWYGTLMLKFRKYLYPAFRARFASKHVDYERNTVEVGYLRYLFGEYLPKGFKNMVNKNKDVELSDTNIKGEKQPYERYALRKATAELVAYGVLTALGLSLVAGSKNADGKKKMTDEEKYALLLISRLRADLDMYHVGMPSEINRQLKNPTASLQTIVAVSNLFQQLMNPNEVYDKKYGNHEKGDSKLKAKMYALIPILKQFNSNVDNKLGYYSLINRNIEGVKPMSSLP